MRVDDGTSFLQDDPAVDCDTSEYWYLWTMSAFGVLLYCVCVPLMYILTVYRYEAQLLIIGRCQEFLERRSFAEHVSWREDHSALQITNLFLTLPRCPCHLHVRSGGR